MFILVKFVHKKWYTYQNIVDVFIQKWYTNHQRTSFCHVHVKISTHYEIIIVNIMKNDAFFQIII